MNVIANCVGLFLSGAAAGVSIARGSAFGSSGWTSLVAGLGIAIIASVNLRRLATRPTRTERAV